MVSTIVVFKYGVNWSFKHFKTRECVFCHLSGPKQGPKMEGIGLYPVGFIELSFVQNRVKVSDPQWYPFNTQT